MGIIKTTKKTKEEILDTSIQALITCLKDLKKHRRFIRTTTRRTWIQEKKIQKEIKRGNEIVLNISKRTLTSAEYRFLGKGLKICPKPKHHDVLQLKQDIFEFTRKLRLKEFFADKE